MQKPKAPAVKNQFANVPTALITRDVAKFVEPTGNVYESLNVIARYSNQVAITMKNEINEKLAEFGNGPDNLEEIHENREQIEISRMYERQPKPIQVALEDFKESKVYWRNPAKETAE
jgi:hypothetical protein